MFVIFYTENLYIFVFMTCSISCCLYNTLMDPRHVHMCVCTSFLTIYMQSTFAGKRYPKNRGRSF